MQKAEHVQAPPTALFLGVGWGGAKESGIMIAKWKAIKTYSGQ